MLTEHFRRLLSRFPSFYPFGSKEIMGRLVWRMDDTPETLERRLKIYREKTAPIIGMYGPGIYVFVDLCYF